MAVAAAVATLTAVALSDDRPRRRRDPRTLEQRPGDAWAGEPIASRPDRPPATRRVRLRIRDGLLAIGSLQCAGFGTAVTPDLSDTAAMPAADWPADFAAKETPT